jgi:5-formaminoimidazole-4-carboxamide-1-beta-D-ribofuranosyl 5'-monophosphate synthetase
MGFNIKNNYGPNIEVNEGGVVNLHQAKNGKWYTNEVEEAEVTESENQVVTKEIAEVEATQEDFFHFIHPALSENERKDIHDIVKRLVVNHGIQEICSYLKQLRKENKVLLPQSPLVAYHELIRMGMPNGEGFSEKTFHKYYEK